MNHTLLYGYGDGCITIFDPKTKQPITVYENSLNYHALRDALNANDKEQVFQLLDEKQVLNNVTNGRVTVTGDTVLLDGEELHSAEAKKLVDLVSEGATNIDRWFRFIEKLHANPSYHCRTQAYNFITHQGMCMTESGNLIGYKGVRDDYKDKHSGKFSNHVGAELSMPRSNVDDNPNNGCSSGFHVGSHEYADGWAGSDGRLMIVEYSPADIVSVPDESGYGKLRVSRYKVIDESHTRNILNDGAYGHETDQTLAIWNHIDELSYGIEPYRIPIYRIQEEFPNADTDLILTSIRNHSDYLASISFSDGEPSEIILNS
jgi:hypothetical protein